MKSSISNSTSLLHMMKSCNGSITLPSTIMSSEEESLRIELHTNYITPTSFKAFSDENRRNINNLRQTWSWRQLQLLSEVYVGANWSLRHWWETRLTRIFTHQHVWIVVDVIVVYFCIFAMDIYCIRGIVIGFILLNYLKPYSYITS